MRMRFTRSIATLLAAGCLAASLSLGSCSPAAKPGAATDSTATAASPADKVKRGEYLVAITGCNDCHTPGYFYGAPDMSRMLSGSEMGWKGPWGISFARNLTPDSTGIGSWTEAQIVTAIRQGHRPDGTPLLPPMPWPDFAHFTDDDAAAVAAYLKSIPPVHHVNLPAVPPKQKYSGAYAEIPPPTAWDAPKAAAK
jgi:mono/diheme cytochrome c family protein